jgi:ligand-binding sensor domain-containing protein/DNA-binding CsgD family transcriptional regulator
MLKRNLTSCVLLLSFIGGFSQSYISKKEVINFTKKNYLAGTQNWNIQQDAEGIVYFGNNEGVLTYDGNYWKLFPLPNKTIVRSIHFGENKQLYVGGQDEIGYFKPNKDGILSYTSLKNLIDEADQKFEDIWDIISYNEDIFFRSTFKIFKLHKDKISVYQPWTSWLFMGIHQGQLIAHDQGKGILQYNTGKWEVLIDKKVLPKDFFITSICPFENYSLITTAMNGIFLLKGKELIPFTLKGPLTNNRDHFTSSVKISDSTFILGTYSNGVLFIDKNGTVIDNYNLKDGLQNNNIKSILSDRNHNIWLGLDNGIDLIPYNNAIKHINPPIFKDAAGYAIAEYEGNLYFALSNGIFKQPILNTKDLSNAKENLVFFSEGLTWNLNTIGDQLFAGKEEGFLQIDHGQNKLIDKTTGYWNFQPMKVYGNHIAFVAGNYHGLHLYELEKGIIKDNGIIANLNTSSRFVAIEENLNIIWISHPYRGVYKITENGKSIKLYTQVNGLPSTLDNHVFKIKNKILIATSKGLYEYNPQKDQFEPSTFYKTYFNDISIRYLKEDADGNIWFVHEKNIGVLDLTKPTPNLIYIPELNDRILSGFEHIYPINKNNIFVGGEKGFYHINFETYKQNIHPVEVFIRSIRVGNEDKIQLFGGFKPILDSSINKGENSPVKIKYKWNSLHFEYSAPHYEQQSNLEYSYYLDGFDMGWSDWSKKTEKEYTNLPKGNYYFKVKARNSINNESTITIFSFEILPPWYSTIWAIIMYTFIGFMMLYFLNKKQEKKLRRQQEKKLQIERKKHEEEQIKLSYQHQLELEKSEKELAQLINEKLESDIEFKNSELAATALNLVQKKEFLLKIRDELNKIMHLNKIGGENIETNELKKILRSLSEDEILNDEWEQFSSHFNKVHSDFLVVLKNKYPDLKPHELKLCAFLSMNLSSKEIAHLMSISVRGVEISRYRLRKKLQLSSEVNLFQFLFDLESSSRKDKDV